MLISDAVENYLIHLEAMGRAPRTIQSARERLAYFQTFFRERGVSNLDALTPELIDLYIVSMRRKELSPVTVAGRQQALKAFLAWCVKRGYMRKSPAAHLKKPRLNFDARNKAMRQKDLDAMLKRAHDDGRLFEEAALALLADTGCRPGELCSITVQDIDHLHREIRVRGKTGERIVDYTEITEEILGRYLEYRASIVQTGVDALFVNTKGLPATTNVLYLRFRALARSVGNVERFNPQSIRHRVGQGWVDAGANLELVRLKLGHRDITTTSMFYANQDRERIKDATAKYTLLRHPKRGE